jgi:hypothetical protein
MRQKLYFFIVLIVGFTQVNCSGSNTSSSKKETTEKGDSTVIDSATVQEPVFESGLKIKTSERKKESCFDPVKDDEDVEEFCSSRSVEFISVELTNKEAEKLINDRILKAVIGNEIKPATLKSWLNEINTLEENEEAYTESVSCTVVEKSKKLLVVSVVSDYYFYMAAHPSVTLQLFNFDLTSGKTVALSDIFKAGYGKELTKIAEKLFIRQNGYSGWDFSPGKGDFKLAQEFYLTENGIVFSYNQYEIGPYAAGMPEVTIPLDKIKHLLKDEAAFMDLLSIATPKKYTVK